MVSSPPTQPALGQSVRLLVVGQGVASEETAQGVGMSRMAQPYQGFGVKLASPLAAEPQSDTNLTVEGRRMAVQAIASDDDVPQTGRQALE